jgi:hypothetical protein
VSIISVNPRESKAVTIDAIYGDHAYIQLETTPQSLLSGIGSLHVYKDRIYIFDNGNIPAIFCFDMQGKFLFKIANHGQGPGETERIAQFCIDETCDFIWIADNFQKILKHDLDGRFIQEYRTDCAIKDRACVPGSQDLLAIRFGYYEGKHYEAGIYSLSNQRVLTHKDYATDFERIVGGSTVMSEYRENLVYASGFTDTLYYMDEKGFHPRYAFDFGKYKIPIDMIQGKDNRKFVVEFRDPSRNYAGLIGQPIETDEYVTFLYSFRGENRLSIYSKESKTVRTLDKILVDNEEQNIASFFETYHDGYYYSVISPVDISGISEDNVEISGYGVYNDLVSLKSALHADDNPVIVFGKSNIHTLFEQKP